MKKAVFFDIDGTIWDENQQIPDSTRAALRALKENGHYLFICSGRTRVFIPDKELMPLGFDGIAGGCGTYVEMEGRVPFYYQIPAERIRQDCEMMNRMNARYILEGRNYLYVDEERYGKENPFLLNLKEKIGESIIPVEGNEEKLEVSKFCVNYPEDEGVRRELEQELSKNYEVIHREEDFIEAVPKGFSKVTGIKEICRLLQIAHEDTYSFGDSTNDLDMLRYTAHSAAMGDGMEEAKNAAEYVTAELWKDGIYLGLKHYGLI